MTATEFLTNKLGRMMQERVTCILRMQAVQLNLDWTAKFSSSQLLSCCTRMEEYLDCTVKYPQNVQRELIRSLEFAPWLSRLMDLAKKEAADTEAEDRMQSLDNLAQRVDKLLETCWANKISVADYSEADVLFVLNQSDLTTGAELAYLVNYANTELEDGGPEQIIKNLSACDTVPAVLDDSQQALLTEPFVGTRYLFASADFEDVWKLFQFSPKLADIAQMLHAKDISEYLTLENYQHFAEDGSAFLCSLSLVLQRLKATAASRFIHHWQNNNCALSELQRMERLTRTASAEELDNAMTSYTGYVNLLCGSKFKNISLYGLTEAQQNLLIYAITHNKKHFIRLIDEHADQFLRLSIYSILFHKPLYHNHFNLNELTEKDLKDCGWMTIEGLPESMLANDRQYTFAELKLLYNMPDAYAVLYRKLSAPRLDDRIKVLRQLRKRNVLHEINREEDLIALARMLDQKPLANWRQEELGHIRDIRAEEAAQLLIHLDKLRPLLPGIQCQTDVMLVLRSLDHIDRFDSVDALKANLLEVDQDWQTLASTMELSPDFMSKYQENTIKFLCRDGAGIAKRYLYDLDAELRPAFHCVVKAELMGQFSDLKYHTGDLEQELDYPLSAQTKVEWMRNLSLSEGSTQIWERDDFFSTMLLGTQPQETCLSYRGGIYGSCLLACFDSNKKVLYAEKDGRIVGRACIRLTKCCLKADLKNQKEPSNKFTFVDLEAASCPLEERHRGEQLTLFLEHPYYSGLNPQDKLQAETLFIKLVQQKAEMLGALLVLSMDYRVTASEAFAQTSLHLYISASKAGGQYLDSLGGMAEISSEGSYKRNSFLVKQEKKPPTGVNKALCA